MTKERPSTLGSESALRGPHAASECTTATPSPPEEVRASIGVLAYNESASIGTTLRSAFDQGFIRNPPANLKHVEIVVVANGCTDDTAAKARQTILDVEPLDNRVRARVEELERGSKVHAWNCFVHKFADPEATHLIFMDGDIRIDHSDTLRNLVATLDDRPEANLSAPEAVKHIDLKPRPTPVEWLSRKLGALNRARPWGFAGCCYCLRGPVARRIWLPEGMIGEDAFLHGLVVTDLCRHPDQFNRVARAHDARVVFEAYTRVGKMYRVLRRQAVTRGTNAMLWSDLWSHVTPEADAGELIRRRNAEDPEWFLKLVRAHVAKAGWWVMPKGAVTRRLRYLRYLPPWRALQTAPAACIGCAIDLVVHIAANRIIRRGEISGLWETTRTTQI